MTELAWTAKDLLYGQNKIFSCGTQQAINLDLTPQKAETLDKID